MKVDDSALLTKEYNFDTDIKTIQSLDIIDVEYIQEETRSVILNCPEQLMDKTDIKMEGNTLSVGMKKSTTLWNISGDLKIKLTVSAPNVTNFSTSGSADIITSDLNGTDYEFLSQGSGDITTGSITATSLNATSLGSGDLDIAGFKGKDAWILTQGSGDVDIKSIHSDFAQFSSQGSGDIEAHLSDCGKVEVKSFGSGDIELSGKCSQFTEEALGSGKIKYHQLSI